MFKYDLCVVFRLLMCGIQEIYNMCLIDAQNAEILDKKLFNYFNNLIKSFVYAWSKQEEEHEIKKKEEESLYKIK